MIRHLTDQELINCQFGLAESGDLHAAKDHVTTCTSCQQRLRTLCATLDQLDLVRDAAKAPETLIANTLHRARGDMNATQEPAVDKPAGRLVDFSRIFWWGAAAAAAALAVVATPHVMRHYKPAPAVAMAPTAPQKKSTLDERVDAAGTENTKPRAARELSKAEMPRPFPVAKPEANTPAAAVASAPAGNTYARASESREEKDRIAPQATGMARGGGEFAGAQILQADALKAKAAPTPMSLAAAAPPVPATLPVTRAPAEAKAGAAVENLEKSKTMRAPEPVEIALPDVSGEWNTGPGNSIRARATVGDKSVQFRFANESAAMAADIRIHPAGRTNALLSIPLPPGAATNVTVKLPVR